MAQAVDKVETIKTPISLTYQYTAGSASSRFLRAIKDGRIIGLRCGECHKVYVPPRGSCPRCGVAIEDEVEVEGTGTVTTFTVVHIPLPGSEIKPPFVSGTILLDGADQTFLHFVGGCEPGEVRVGLRVRPVWRPKGEWSYSLENIRHFEPTGEPDVPFENLREYV